MITSEEIKQRLWDGATELRGSMDASRYKDYMLGLMFYKFLSDKTLETFAISAGINQGDDLLEAYKVAHGTLGEKLEQMIQKVIGFFVLPEHLYQTWINDINSGNFEVQKVTDSLNNFERTIAVSKDSDDFKGLFSSSTLDLTDTALGSSLNERSKNIKALIRLFEDLDMVALQKGDVLGDAYEYLIGQFAMESGKKAGEFYTPRQVSEVMAQIVAKNSMIEQKAHSSAGSLSIYDPTVGSGSLLLTVKSHLPKQTQSELSYYGQEKNTATYNLTRMNLLLHGVRPEKMTIRNADTLAHDWPEDPQRPNEGIQFDGVVMNPPYSLKNWNRADLKVSDPRFEMAGVLPPDSKGDLAFLLHGFYHLGQTGTMAIVLPHGVLFRGGSEGEIRKRLIEKNHIDAVIGLPSNLFTNTGIPVCVVILKKNRELSEPVLFIDASRSFVKVGKINELQEKDIAKIVDTYIEKKETVGYSHLATRQELIQNEYNMNIPRYVSVVDDEIPHDVDAHLHGGIPVENLELLPLLNSIVKDVLDATFEPLREGYVHMNQSINDLTQRVLSDNRIQSISEDLYQRAESYIQQYWEILHQVDDKSNLSELKSKMLSDIMAILLEYPYIDMYTGYQIIVEIWKNTLHHDIELIAASGFYETARTRVKNMVNKGKNKEKVQDGWVGAIIPNDLIAKQLYSVELKSIEDKKQRGIDIDTELLELVESSKVEESDENAALFDVLKKNEDDEPQDSFDNKLVKAELKLATKDTVKHELLHKVESLSAEKASLNKAIKAEEQELKEAIYERILVLTDEEIDSLLFEKWFGSTAGSIASLVEIPLKKELATLELLVGRYSDTLDDIDSEISSLEQQFESLIQELVVT